MSITTLNTNTNRVLLGAVVIGMFAGIIGFAPVPVLAQTEYCDLRGDAAQEQINLGNIKVDLKGPEGRVEIFNDTNCRYWFELATYGMYGNDVLNQRFYAGSGSNPVYPHNYGSANVALPPCHAQIDMFSGEAPHDLTKPVPNTVLYGGEFVFSSNGYCVDPTPTPTATPTPTPAIEKGLDVEKTDNKDVTRPGHSLTYVIKVKNTGNVDLHDVAITDTVPAQLTVTSIANGGTQDGNTITWKSIKLDADASKEVTFTARVKDNAPNAHVLHNVVKAESRDRDLKETADDDTKVERQPAVAAAKKTVVTPVPVVAPAVVAVPVTAKTGAGMIGLVSALTGAAGLALSIRRSL